jgi:hypothetical protein
MIGVISHPGRTSRFGRGRPQSRPWVGSCLRAGPPLLPHQGATRDRLNLVCDVILARIVTWDFAVFYITPWLRCEWPLWAAWQDKAPASWP